MKFFQIIVAGIYSVCATAYGADTISIQHGHPLSALAIELQERYGYAVTYEEAPFDTAKLQSTKLANGVSFLSIPPMSIVFQVPAMTVGATLPAALNRIPAGLPDVMLPLVADYLQADGAMFSVLFEGGYAHIVPVNQVVNGAAQPFQPILGTMVAMSVKGSSCSQALDSLLAQVNTARGVRVVRGIVPIGPLMGHICSLNVNNLPARDVLASILHQAGAGGGDPNLKARYSWALLHDPNTDKYFLSTSIIPSLNPTPIPPAAPPTVDAPAAAPNAPSRLSVPSGLQK